MPETQQYRIHVNKDPTYHSKPQLEVASRWQSSMCGGYPCQCAQHHTRVKSFRVCPRMRNREEGG